MITVNYFVYRYEYSRSGNPTRKVLESCLASLDGAKHAIAFSSGLGATTALTHLLSKGDHIVSMNDLYGGTNRYFRKVASRLGMETIFRYVTRLFSNLFFLMLGVETTFVDATDPQKVKEAMQPNTKMVWVETPSNPTLKITDIQAVADIVHQQKDVILVVDNTFESAYFQVGKYINSINRIGNLSASFYFIFNNFRDLWSLVPTFPTIRSPST